MAEDGAAIEAATSVAGEDFLSMADRVVMRFDDVGRHHRQVPSPIGARAPHAEREGYYALPPLLLLLPLLRPFAGALAVAGVTFRLQHPFLAGVERAGLGQPGHHLDPLPDAHLHHLLHQRPHRVELLEELAYLVR